MEYWNVKADAKRACSTTFRSVLKVFFCLAREADDDIGGDGSVWDLRANAFQDPEELGGSVASPHRLEDAVRPGLQRHVELGHDRGGFGHGVDDVIGEGGRDADW
jgi:hypothetical protein